jgi:hypothetical protein
LLERRRVKAGVDVRVENCFYYRGFGVTLYEKVKSVNRFEGRRMRFSDEDFNKAILNRVLRRDPSADLQTALSAGFRLPYMSSRVILSTSRAPNSDFNCEQHSSPGRHSRAD